MAGRIAVVDDHNRFVRWEARRVIHEQRLVHRSIHALIVDGAGRLLVQRRHASKQTYPRFWDVSCAGHVEESDYPGDPDSDLDAVYAAVAAREVEEELGVTPALELVGRFGPVIDVHYEQIHLFRGTSDGPFVLQADEVEEHRLLARAALPAFLASGEPITDALRFWLRLLDDGIFEL
jgi:isopentenyldiphosphate isomerase